MARVLYAGVGGTARRIKKLYAGVNGFAARIKKMYVGVNGVARECFNLGVFESYSGNFTVASVLVNGRIRSLYALTSSGVLTVKGKVEFWMCSGGQAGMAGTTSSSYDMAWAGSGGRGGASIQGQLTQGDWTIVIGAGGSQDFEYGGLSSIENSSAAHTTGTPSDSNCGSGSGHGGAANKSGGYNTSGYSGSGKETSPFGITELGYHCAGGGGGSAVFRNPEYPYTTEVSIGGDGGSNGLNGGSSSSKKESPSCTTVFEGGTGGEKGGGNGGSASYQAAGDGFPATFYGGGGGGGGSAYTPNLEIVKGTFGAGYQGVVYILD